MGNLDTVIAIIAATGGLGLAAMSLVDALKAIPGGGVSKIGFNHILDATRRFADVLKQATGDDWSTVLLSHWINGRPRTEQIGVIRSLLRLGLNAETAPQLATVGNVDAGKLAKVAEKLVAGQDMTEEELNLLGRAEAAVEARLDAAFDLADQAYRNKSRVIAGLLAVLLSLGAALAIGRGEDWALAIVIGVLAVPIAPITKDLVSALTAAANAVKSTRKP